ncbi:MAG: hypothetical protein EA376_08245 [Phycisphaeraceae bacterium]|nr:MAG: hypothetical protein EA376_08245 [Phycisphaeraceae bacterium]
MSSPTPLVRFDVGWLYLLPGLAIVAATVLIPAHDDVAEAEWRRDRAAAALDRRVDRLRNYSEYLDALERSDEAVVLDLAATQLNLAPANRRPVVTPLDRDRFNASVFPALEPPPLTLPQRELPETLLRRLTTSDHTRLWLIAGGMMCILFGLLPPARGRGEDDEASG